MRQVDCGMGKGLGDRIRHYFEYCWTRHRDFAPQDLVTDLPMVFKRRVCMQVHQSKLRSFPLFKEAEERCVNSRSTTSNSHFSVHLFSTPCPGSWQRLPPS